MQLSFPNAEHSDVLAGDGIIRIGSAAGNDIILADLAAQHARLTRDARGIVLEITETGARAHVNARPVREKAFVRYGDTVCLGSISIVVSAIDADEFTEVMRTFPVHGPHRGVLRGMSGAWFGKSVAITDGLLLGIGKDGGAVLVEAAESTRTIRFNVGASGLSLDSAEFFDWRLNGRSVAASSLRNGDQLTVGRDRFVIECSSAKPLEDAVVRTDVDDDSGDAPADEERRNISAIWWLLGAAALIGLVLVAILLRGV